MSGTPIGPNDGRGDRFAARLQQVPGVEAPLRPVPGNPTAAGPAIFPMMKERS